MGKFLVMVNERAKASGAEGELTIYKCSSYFLRDQQKIYL